MGVVTWLLLALLVYAAIGAAFAIAFVVKGVATIDPAAEHSSSAFRALIFPGSVALWPLMLAKWRAARRTP